MHVCEGEKERGEDIRAGLNVVTWCWGGGGVRLPWLGPGAFFLAAPAAASCSWGNWFGLLYTRGLFQEAAPLQRHVSLLSISTSGIREGGSQAHRSSSAYYKGLPSLSLSLPLWFHFSFSPLAIASLVVMFLFFSYVELWIRLALASWLISKIGLLLGFLRCSLAICKP
jgi:hypothetical protein